MYSDDVPKNVVNVCGVACKGASLYSTGRSHEEAAVVVNGSIRHGVSTYKLPVE